MTAAHACEAVASRGWSSRLVTCRMQSRCFLVVGSAVLRCCATRLGTCRLWWPLMGGLCHAAFALRPSAGSKIAPRLARVAPSWQLVC